MAEVFLDPPFATPKMVKMRRRYHASRRRTPAPRVWPAGTILQTFPELMGNAQNVFDGADPSQSRHHRLGFALLYWEFDSGGPSWRANGGVPYPDFAFPPQTAPPGWSAAVLAKRRIMNRSPDAKGLAKSPVSVPADET